MSQSPENSGGGAVATHCGWVTVGEMANVYHGFFTITPLFGTIASWGFSVQIHHFEREINLLGEKLWNKQNNQTRIAADSGLSLCTVTNAHHQYFKLFLSYEELTFSVRTKHAAYLVYAVSVTLEGEETDEQTMPALLTASIEAGMPESASTRQHRPLVFSTSPFSFPQPPL